MVVPVSEHFSRVASPNGTVYREPPAPSHKSKAKAFVFPVAASKANPPANTSNKPNLLIKQPCSIPNIASFDKPCEPYPSQPESPISGSHNPSHLTNKNDGHHFSRSELFKQLEVYRRELLKRDAQIELLKKIISDNIARPPSVDSSLLLQ